jgi:hypothetical protein
MNHRRVAQRNTCAEKAAETWEPEWDNEWARQRVDLQKYNDRVQVRLQLLWTISFSPMRAPVGASTFTEDVRHSFTSLCFFGWKLNLK